MTGTKTSACVGSCDKNKTKHLDKYQTSTSTKISESTSTMSTSFYHYLGEAQTPPGRGRPRTGATPPLRSPHAATPPQCRPHAAPTQPHAAPTEPQAAPSPHAISRRTQTAPTAAPTPHRLHAAPPPPTRSPYTTLMPLSCRPYAARGPPLRRTHAASTPPLRRPHASARRRTPPHLPTGTPP